MRAKDQYVGNHGAQKARAISHVCGNENEVSESVPKQSDSRVGREQGCSADRGCVDQIVHDIQDQRIAN